MATANLSDLRALVVDDEPFIANLISRQLSQLGVGDVAVADGGQAALDLLDGADQPPDVVFSDLNMPGMDGIEFLQHLADRKFQNAVVLISGEDERVIDTVAKIVDRFDLNIVGAVAKPVKAPDLEGLLAKIGGAA